MTKRYLSPKTIRLLVVTGIFLGAFFLNPGGFLNPLRNFVFLFTVPFQKAFYHMGERSSKLIYFLSSIGGLRRENEELLQENNFLRSELAKIAQEKTENVILREQLKLLPKEKFSLVGGFVIGQDSQGMESWIIVDKGGNDGLEIGMPVIVSGGILIGKVSEIYSNSAKIDLLSNASSVVNILDVETGARGIVRGEYGLGLVLDMVNQSDSLREGDMLVSSGLGGNMPRGLFIGKIKELKSTRDRLFQRAVIVPGIKYSKLDVVFIIKSGQY